MTLACHGPHVLRNELKKIFTSARRGLHVPPRAARAKELVVSLDTSKCSLLLIGTGLHLSSRPILVCRSMHLGVNVVSVST